MFGKKSHDTRVSALLDQLDLKYNIDKDGDYKLVFEVGEGRSQLAFINSNTHQFGGFEVRDIWSIAHSSEGPLGADLANKLLVRNSLVKIGAWRVMTQGEARLAVFAVQVAADTDSDSLLVSIQAVLQVADELEKELSGARDQF